MSDLPKEAPATLIEQVQGLDKRELSPVDIRLLLVEIAARHLPDKVKLHEGQFAVWVRNAYNIVMNK